MSTRPLRREEMNLKEICSAVAQLQQGRSNAHGSFTLDDDGVATSTAVTAPTCSANSHVNITATNANGGNKMRTADFYVVADNGSFTVHHAATALSCTYTYSING